MDPAQLSFEQKRNIFAKATSGRRSSSFQVTSRLEGGSGTVRFADEAGVPINSSRQCESGNPKSIQGFSPTGRTALRRACSATANPRSSKDNGDECASSN